MAEGSHDDHSALPDDDSNRKLAKLAKINQALMQRVERSMDQQANAFSLFQTAISQEAQIRLRTEQLNNALTKLAQANEDLRGARDAAERANQFKTRFFTAVGHDLLQPLHAARLTLSELSDAQIDPANQTMAERLSMSLNSIEELLTSILDISKLEAGVFVPNLQPVRLQDLFARLATSLEPLAKQKGLELRWRPTNLTVLSDPLMLRRMIQNLLANAVHYSTRGGILLAARKKAGAISIEVWDTGPGIAAREQNRIFQEFQRGESTRGTGFGLGLTIVQRMSEALHHTLDLQSRIGRGSCFSLRVPAASEGGDAAATQTASHPDDDATPPSTMQMPSLKGCNVLVIDNDLGVLDAMNTLLSRWGARASLARDLEEIDDILAQAHGTPELILADYHLDHDVLGLEAIAAVRAHAGRKVPAILITADRSEATQNAARLIDCEVLHKPVRPSELRAVMQHILSAARPA